MLKYITLPTKQIQKLTPGNSREGVMAYDLTRDVSFSELFKAGQSVSTYPGNVQCDTGNDVFAYNVHALFCQ